MNYYFLENRIEVRKEKEVVAYLAFEKIGKNTIEITSTFVSPSLRGLKIAGTLMEKMYQYATENHYKIKPTCSYAKHWIEQQEKQNILL